jgi:hypothetical protein
MEERTNHVQVQERAPVDLESFWRKEYWALDLKYWHLHWRHRKLAEACLILALGCLAALLALLGLLFGR